MNGYGNSKTDDVLIIMMEDMQDELEQMKNRLAEKDKTIAKLQKQLQTSVPSSTVSALKNKIQEQADEIVSLNEHIVRLNSADLILKDNVRLKEENSRIVRETEKAVSNVRKEIDDEKQKLGMQAMELIEAEKKVKKYQAYLDDRIADQNEHIKKEASAMSAKTRKDCEILYHKKERKLENEYKAKNAGHISIYYGTISYSIILTLLTALSSELFIRDAADFFITIWEIFCMVVDKIKDLCFNFGGLSYGISNPIGQKIVFVLLFSIPILIAITIEAVVVLLGDKYIKWYKEKIADYISLFVAFITLAISTTLSEYVKAFLPINLIALNIIIHLIYSGFRHYVIGCKRNKGY